MGVPTAPVAASGAEPACTATVERACLRLRTMPESNWPCHLILDAGFEKRTANPLTNPDECQRMKRVMALLVPVVLLTAGCTGLYQAYAPDSVLKNGWSENTNKRSTDERFGFSRSTRVYEFSGSGTQGPYPAQFVVITAKTIGGGSREAILKALDQSLKDVLAKESIQADEGSRAEGQRTLGQGQSSVHFTYTATAKAGSSFFQQDRKMRVLGEVFNDGRSSTTVMLIGLAQTTGGTILTGSENLTEWSRIVGDPNGSIGGFKRADGLAYNVVSHG
jgi:hypothetical protein